jgi:LPXTG-motif cell wall-anchored protein
MSHRFCFILGMALALMVAALPAAAQTQLAYVRVRNTNVDSPTGIFVQVGEQTVVAREAALQLGEQSAYTAITPGAAPIRVFVGDQDVPIPRNSVTATFASGQAYTIRVSGDTVHPQIEVVQDGPVTLPDTGAASTTVSALLLGIGGLASGVLLRRRLAVR